LAGFLLANHTMKAGESSTKAPNRDCYKVGKEGYKSNSGATEQVAPEIQKKGVSG
jgi:hypothetical protein